MGPGKRGILGSAKRVSNLGPEAGSLVRVACPGKTHMHDLAQGDNTGARDYQINLFDGKLSEPWTWGVGHHCNKAGLRTDLGDPVLPTAQPASVDCLPLVLGLKNGQGSKKARHGPAWRVDGTI